MFSLIVVIRQFHSKSVSYRVSDMFYNSFIDVQFIIVTLCHCWVHYYYIHRLLVTELFIYYITTNILSADGGVL